MKNATLRYLLIGGSIACLAACGGDSDSDSAGTGPTSSEDQQPIDEDPPGGSSFDHMSTADFEAFIDADPDLEVRRTLLAHQDGFQSGSSYPLDIGNVVVTRVDNAHNDGDLGLGLDFSDKSSGSVVLDDITPMLYLDTDQRDDTGYQIGDIGADIRIADTGSANKLQGGLATWDEVTQTWVDNYYSGSRSTGSEVANGNIGDRGFHFVTVVYDTTNNPIVDGTGAVAAIEYLNDAGQTDERLSVTSSFYLPNL